MWLVSRTELGQWLWEQSTKLYLEFWKERKSDKGVLQQLPLLHYHLPKSSSSYALCIQASYVHSQDWFAEVTEILLGGERLILTNNFSSTTVH